MDRLTCEELAGDDASCPDVARGMESEFSPELGRLHDLRRCVRQKAFKCRGGFWHGLFSSKASGIEIGDLAREVGQKTHQFVRSEIAMDDLQRMKLAECLENLNAIHDRRVSLDVRFVICRAFCTRIFPKTGGRFAGPRRALNAKSPLSKMRHGGNRSSSGTNSIILNIDRCSALFSSLLQRMVTCRRDRCALRVRIWRCSLIGHRTARGKTLDQLCCQPSHR